MRKNIRNRRKIEDLYESNVHQTLENDDLTGISPRSNLTEISFQSYDENEFENDIDSIEQNKSNIDYLSSNIKETKEINCKEFRKIEEIPVESNLINASSKEAKNCNKEIKYRINEFNQGIKDINDDIPKLKNIISKLNGQNADLKKNAINELKSFNLLEQSMEKEFNKGYSKIKEIKGKQAKKALLNYNKLFKKFTEIVKKSFEEVIKKINQTNKAGEVYQIISDTYYTDINTELTELETKLMEFESLKDFDEMHENLRELINPATNIHKRTLEKCNDFKQLNEEFLKKQKLSNSKIKFNEMNCKIILDKMIKMRKKLYEKVNLERKKEGKESVIPDKNEINIAINELSKEFEKESGKFSKDGDYTIDNLYNAKQGFEKSSEKNIKEIKKVLKEEEKVIQNISEKWDIKKKCSIDIQILMDITGSMDSYLSEAKTLLKKLVSDLIHNFMGLTVRISFIGYRDIDRNLKEEENVDIDFTEQHEYIKNRIEDCKASGGGDTCEDVAGALEKGIKKNWNSKARYVILVCDAPAHGNKYHNDCSDDDFPQGDPKGRNIDTFIHEYYNLNVNFFCVEITSITNIMFNCFRNIYKSNNSIKGKGLFFEVKKLNNTSELKDYIVESSKKVFEISKSKD